MGIPRDARGVSPPTNTRLVYQPTTGPATTTTTTTDKEALTKFNNWLDSRRELRLYPDPSLSVWTADNVSGSELQAILSPFLRSLPRPTTLRESSSSSSVASDGSDAESHDDTPSSGGVSLKVHDQSEKYQEDESQEEAAAGTVLLELPGAGPSIHSISEIKPTLEKKQEVSRRSLSSSSSSSSSVSDLDIEKITADALHEARHESALRKASILEKLKTGGSSNQGGGTTNNASPGISGMLGRDASGNVTPVESEKSNIDEEMGPMPLGHSQSNLRGHKVDYGNALRRSEAEAMAEFVQSGKRIPRRGEVGLTAEEIETYESLGYVMSGSRHRRMNSVRIRKENQVYSAEEQRALAMFNLEEKINKEQQTVAELQDLLRAHKDKITREKSRRQK